MTACWAVQLRVLVPAGGVYGRTRATCLHHASCPSRWTPSPSTRTPWPTTCPKSCTVKTTRSSSHLQSQSHPSLLQKKITQKKWKQCIILLIKSGKEEVNSVKRQRINEQFQAEFDLSTSIRKEIKADKNVICMKSKFIAWKRASCWKFTNCLVVDRFYVALFSTLQQTHCAHMWFCMSE